MEKVLVEVYVPILSRSFDLFVPRTLPIHQVTALLKQAVSDLSDRGVLFDEQTVLCYRKDGVIIDVNKSVGELGIYHGTKLMLM